MRSISEKDATRESVNAAISKKGLSGDRPPNQMHLEKCSTIREALIQINSIQELEGFVGAIKNTGLNTMTPSRDEWAVIANMKIRLGGEK